MYVVTNTIRVPAEHAGRIEQGFSGAAERMAQVAGCVGFLFLKDEDAGEQIRYVALTQWENEAAFNAWISSDSFRHAHAGGNPSASGEIHRYTVIAELE